MFLMYKECGCYEVSSIHLHRNIKPILWFWIWIQWYTHKNPVKIKNFSVNIILNAFNSSFMNFEICIVNSPLIIHSIFRIYIQKLPLWWIKIKFVILNKRFNSKQKLKFNWFKANYD